MSKTINIKTKDGQVYKLEFTRKTVAAMAREGFKLSDVRENPVIGIPDLFEGAFLANHKKISNDLVRQIYESLPNKEELITTLIEMYSEPVNALIEDPEDNEGNGSWEVSQ